MAGSSKSSSPLEGSSKGSGNGKQWKSGTNHLYSSKENVHLILRVQRMICTIFHLCEMCIHLSLMNSFRNYSSKMCQAM